MNADPKAIAAMARSLDDGIRGISEMAESYAKPYIPQITSKLIVDLWKAGFQITARAHEVKK
jgi:hypothetical protein